MSSAIEPFISWGSLMPIAGFTTQTFWPSNAETTRDPSIVISWRIRLGRFAMTVIGKSRPCIVTFPTIFMVLTPRSLSRPPRAVTALATISSTVGVCADAAATKMHAAMNVHAIRELQIDGARVRRLLEDGAAGIAQLWHAQIHIQLVDLRHDRGLVADDDDMQRVALQVLLRCRFNGCGLSRLRSLPGYFAQ